MKKPKFKKRYILGEGYPWAVGVGNYQAIQLCVEPMRSSPITLDWPVELWSKDLPRYRLVLERIDGKEGK